MTPFEWFAARRGIRRETLDAFGVTLDGDAIKFPYPGGAHKYRKGLEKDDDRKFWWDPPTQAGQVPFLPPDFTIRERMILAEGETDTMALWQALPDALRDKVGIFGLSGLNAWKERYVEELVGDAKRLFLAIDNDDPYEAPDAAKAGEAAWLKIREQLGRKARRVKLPQGINDLAEFFMQYDWAAFEALLKAAAEPKRHFPRIDWDKPVPETDWLVEDFLVQGEVNVLAGDSGVGKSFISQALAKAVASGDERFLGRTIHRHGVVVYVDEENAEVLVRQRLAALGLEAEHREHLEYISNAGVNLWNDAALLLEDVMDVEPVLIVLDSQSAVSLGAEENSNDDMTALYVRAFKPLARMTGATVVILHHTPKDGSGPRGGGAIKAQADQVYTVIPAEAGGHTTGRLNIFASKARRQVGLLQAVIEGDVEHDGWVQVRSAVPEDEAM